MAASMGQAFAIQTFFIPVLKELPDPKQYWKFVLIAYGIGSTVYVYIAYAGSFGTCLCKIRHITKSSSHKSSANS